MVGLVFVSHSAKLAEGVKEIAEQMTQGKCMIAVAGGIDDPQNPFGTDPIKVKAAIESVYGKNGVLVIMDLGSALLSAEMALEFLDPEQAQNVKLCAAPLVEGAVAAAVQASIGANIADVMNEALNALRVKSEQLAQVNTMAPPLAPSRSPAVPLPGQEKIKLTLTILNRNGLHARPAANFVKAAGLFQANITVAKGTKIANAKSINQMTLLDAGQGDQIEVRASGPQARQATELLKVLAENKFNEKDEETAFVTLEKAAGLADTRENVQGAIAGIPVSAGIAVGPVAHYHSRFPEIKTRQIQDTQSEINKLQAAVSKAGKDLEQLRNQAAQKLGAIKAAIFDAQKMFLNDPALLDAVQDAILTQQCNAESAWQKSIDAMAKEYRKLTDPYLREQAVDLIDVGRRVLVHLIGRRLPTLELAQPAILFAKELTPSDTVQLSPDNVLAICTALGGQTSHSAIVAKALGIPTIVGLGEDILTWTENDIIALDGTQGLVWPHPTQSQLTECQTRRERWQTQQQQAKALAQTPASTMGRNPKTIKVVANSDAHDTKTILDYGAEGVGLFRTEFLFLGRLQAPCEKEQLQTYTQMANIMQTRPLVIRTLDLGADKTVPYLNMAPENNPFLGLRGIRFCLAHIEIFKTQLRAILKASPGHNIKIMFPMISTPEEFCEAKAVLNEVKQELKSAGIPFDENMEVGLMIEVPSAVAVADQLAGRADFFSIGSNDLTQYIMGADRGNRKVNHLVNALNPAVLRMVAQTARAARKAGIWVGMCGELAANPLAAPVLIGLGLDELSMNAPNIPDVKNAIRHCTMHHAKKMAQTVLTLETAKQVEAYLKLNKEKSVK
ncbi:phosphoenolpyruvate--protein phosphotransferase [uncultured Desulfobacter sp.]|uniref:phosphoenolpyruvate--protein phosphotransferase n=1 Tax=uncultured Desulfobacter sp. TaxID=240139 RepID=UPI002AA6D451|nr:phosphoenolpyruvate--protein phosphotransferase [uncultured Desulfobacter sp.]